MKSGFQSYFSFTKKELNGLLLLCLLIFLILAFPAVYSRLQKPEVYNFSDFDKELKDFLASAKKGGSAAKYYQVRDEIEDAAMKPVYFAFDPNGLDESKWQKLGLSARQIKVIKNYEAKGGRFYKPTDLKKMYSISARQFAALEPYIAIKQREKFEYSVNNREPDKSWKRSGDNAARTVMVIDLNTADSAQLETIRGVGPAFASRISKFRKRLGGFYKKEQLLEVYGIDSSKFESLKDQVSVNQTDIKKININAATFDDLKPHPYLTYKQMNAIIQYRKQHGSFQNIGDLKKIAIVNDEILRKIEPYLLFE